MPSPNELAVPAEMLLLEEMLEKLETAETPDAHLAVFDQILAKVPEPTKFRGFLQLARSGVLGFLDRSPEAIEAVAESVRLLPGYSAPLITAANIHSFGNQPSKAADFLLRAAEMDPESVREIDDYEIGGLLRRLEHAGEHARLRAVSNRLLEIGWAGNRLGSQSNLAFEAIERRLGDADLAGARTLVPKLLVPAHSYGLLTRREFTAIWPDIERWAGPKLSSQWSIYLTEARARWSASKSVDTVRDYTEALLSAGHFDAVIRDIYPRLMGKLDPLRDQELIFVVPQVARALASKGRWTDVESLFEKTEKDWPLKSQTNALNIAANRARYLHLAGRHADGLRQMDVAIAEAKKRDVNPDALVAMHHARICMLHALGRGAEAKASIVLALNPVQAGDAATLHLCRGDEAAAKRVLLQGLEQPGSRRSVIAFMQPDGGDGIASDYARALHTRTTSLKADPELRSAVDKYGRILPFNSSEGAPREGR